MPQSIQDMGKLLGESEIFASQKAYLFCIQLLSDIEENDTQHRKDVDKIPLAAKDFNDRYIAKYKREFSYLEMAKKALGDDIRIGLGLGVLPREQKPIETPLI